MEEAPARNRLTLYRWRGYSEPSSPLGKNVKWLICFKSISRILWKLLQTDGCCNAYIVPAETTVCWRGVYRCGWPTCFHGYGLLPCDSGILSAFFWSRQNIWDRKTKALANILVKSKQLRSWFAQSVLTPVATSTAEIQFAMHVHCVLVDDCRLCVVPPVVDDFKVFGVWCTNAAMFGLSEFPLQELQKWSDLHMYFSCVYIVSLFLKLSVTGCFCESIVHRELACGPYFICSSLKGCSDTCTL